MAEGIDIYSAYQTVNDWNSVRAAGIEWCYQKVSDGLTTRTPQTVAAGIRAGVRQGGYHFSQPGSPQGQADLLMNQCEKYGTVDLSPCLDMEDNPASSGKPNIPNNQKAEWAIAFGIALLNQDYSFTLYANDSDWKNILYAPVMKALPGTFRWVARYGGNPTVTYDAHQYTSTGSVAGISARGVDRNRGKIPLNIGGTVALTADELAILKDIQNQAKYTAAVAGRYPDSQWGGGVDPTTGKPNGTFDLAENVRRLIRADYATSLSSITASLTGLQAKIDQIAVGGVDLDALAVKVADVLAARLKD